MKVAMVAMAGDNAPEAVAQGAVEFARESGMDITLLWMGGQYWDVGPLLLKRSQGGAPLPQGVGDEASRKNGFLYEGRLWPPMRG